MSFPQGAYFYPGGFLCYVFLFQKKKDPFTVRIKEYEQPRFVAGMQTPTTKRSYRKDVSALQTSFNGKRDQLQNRTNPSGTMVIFSLPDSAGSFT